MEKPEQTPEKIKAPVDEEVVRVLGSLGLVDATQYEYDNPDHIGDNIWLSNN